MFMLKLAFVLTSIIQFGDSLTFREFFACMWGRSMGQITYSKYKVTNLLWFAHLAREFLEVLNYWIVPIYWITQALQSFPGYIWLILKKKKWHFLVLSFS